MKINNIYRLGFYIILALPLLVVPPWFFPPDWGKTIVFRSVMAVILALFIYQILFKKEPLNLPDIKKNKIIWCLVALLGAYLLASIFSVDPYFSFWGWPIRSGGFVNLAFCIIFGIASFVLFKKEDWSKMWDFSIIIGALVSLIALMQYYGLLKNIFLAVAGRPASTMGNPILLGLYLLLLFFLTLALTIKEQKLWKKIWHGAVLLLFFYIILLTGSRAAYLGIIIGAVYFFLGYPVFQGKALKRILALKITAIILILAALGMVFYVNTTSQYPEFLQKNRLFNSVAPRLLIKNFIEDSRFEALRIGFGAVKERPLLGYGPENFSVGFDKHYSLTGAPSLTGIIAWWDRAHNIIMQTASDAGILGLVAYLALFILVFWKLHKLKYAEKNADINADNTLMAHGIQTTLIAYFIANLFSFDSFSTYLIFFLLVGYSLHLTWSSTAKATLIATHNNTEGFSENQRSNQRKSAAKKTAFACLFFLLAWFLWQYNIVPLHINAQINKARALIDQKNCGQGLQIMENILPQHSLLDSYVRLEYVEFAKTCGGWYPQNNLGYVKRGLELIGQAIKIQPNYTRYWIFLGSATNDLAAQEKDATVKTALTKQAYYSLNKALELAPRHQEIIAQLARTALIATDFEAAKHYTQNCIDVNAHFSECYFYLGLEQIYEKNVDEAKKNILVAKEGYNVDSRTSLEQLANAYGAILDYQDLVLVYQKLIAINPTVVQYHSSLAFFYKQLGYYKEARQEAMEALRLSPESKQNVDAFLKTLPR